ncbi:MAG: hypothetical protein MUC62_05770 [Candidatus Thermoplasmatota archaeon]|jgi:hypothetical protein|nr:hypothetical protein [Candidatus Thermoplasmatota archaeon]
MLISMGEDDFDFYKNNRDIAPSGPVKDSNTMIIEVPSTGPKVEEPAPKPSVLKKYSILIIAFGVCVAILFGVLLLALIGPMLQGDSMEISINRDGYQSGDTLYMDTDDVGLSISNQGKDTVDGSELHIMISGKNIKKERINYTGGDIGPSKTVNFIIRVQVVDELAPFELTVRLYYKDKFMDSDSIP